MKTIISRRELIQNALMGMIAHSLPISLTACGDDDLVITASIMSFEQGVASGDPLHILWMRLRPNDFSLQ